MSIGSMIGLIPANHMSDDRLVDSVAQVSCVVVAKILNLKQNECFILVKNIVQGVHEKLNIALRIVDYNVVLANLSNGF